MYSDIPKVTFLVNVLVDTVVSDRIDVPSFSQIWYWFMMIRLGGTTSSSGVEAM